MREIVCKTRANAARPTSLQQVRGHIGRKGAAKIAAPALSLRTFVAAFALLSFLLSGFAVQTHIHLESAGAPGAKIALSQSRDHKAPAVPDDPEHCPLCLDFLAAAPM
ncbi:MAG: hypothetical protein WDN01_00020 [Rhizomicrobium sp.]